MGTSLSNRQAWLKSNICLISVLERTISQEALMLTRPHLPFLHNSGVARSRPRRPPRTRTRTKILTYNQADEEDRYKFARAVTRMQDTHLLLHR